MSARPKLNTLGKVVVLKRRGAWHWWCQCCMGGDWTGVWEMTVEQALAHVDKHRKSRIMLATTGGGALGASS